MSQTGEQRLKVDIADALDRRREVLTQTTRVVDVLGGTRLNQQACAMAVPMIYAQWEGFVKEAPSFTWSSLSEPTPSNLTQIPPCLHTHGGGRLGRS
jgi:hypothetical protein